MTDKKRTRGPTVAVVGAGLSGLAAGCFLQLNGYHARLFEHAGAAGGVALTRWTPGHTVEGGAYLLTEHAPGLSAYEMYEALGVVPSEGIETLELLTCVVDQRSGARLAVTRDLDALERDLKAVAPEDSELIETLIEGGKKFQRFDPVRADFLKPPELQGFFDKVALGWHARHVLSVFSDRLMVQHSLAEWLAPMKSEVGRRLLGMIFAYPDVPPWFVMMLLGLLARGQLGRVTGGAEELVQSIKRRFLALGGELTLNAGVAKILVEDDKAVGVLLEDGSTHRAHAVVSTVDTRQLVDRLLERRFLDTHSEEHLSHWKTAAPAGFVHFVTSGSWEQLPWSVQASLSEPFTAAGGASERVTVCFFREGTAGAGAGESVVQFGFQTDYARWKNADDEVRARLEEDVIVEATRVMESMFAGFSARLLRCEVVTPDVFAKILRAPEGVTGAWVPDPTVVNAVCPRRIHGLERLYLAGQWAVGGAGVLAVLYSGRHAVQLLCHDDGVGFNEV